MADSDARAASSTSPTSAAALWVGAVSQNAASTQVDAHNSVVGGPAFVMALSVMLWPT